MRAARAAGAAALLGCAQGAPAALGPRLCIRSGGSCDERLRLRCEHHRRLHRGRRHRGGAVRRGAPGRRQGDATDGVAPNGPVAAAVGASHRLPCAARPGVVRRNSLRSLRELRSDRAPQVRSTKRASRADPEAALLGAAEIAPTGPARAPPLARAPRRRRAAQPVRLGRGAPSGYRRPRRASIRRSSHEFPASRSMRAPSWPSLASMRS